jgi:lysophospholipase L1-like esterase
LGNTGNTAAGWNQLRMRQTEIAMRKLVMTDIDGIADNADKTHYSTAGYIEIGERMADAIAPML